MLADSPSSTANLRGFLRSHIEDKCLACEFTQQMRLRRALRFVDNRDLPVRTQEL